MSKIIKRNLISLCILLILFLVLLFCLLWVDVRAIGPNGSTIGLATINQYVWKMTGVNMNWYYITDYLGLIGIFTAFLFALLGLSQLIKRKSLSKVDLDIYFLGVFYVVLIVIYGFFEINVVNYRPILMDGNLEASFPSSHTLMICCVMGSAMLQFKMRIKNRIILNVVNAMSVIVMLVTVMGRLISGVHWFSDIIGGLLLSGIMVSLYNSCILYIQNKDK